MAATSYKIRGIAPPDLANYPVETRKMFWRWVVDLGLKAKDEELAKGWDKDGNPMRPISEETRKHRRSAMTPSGKGDPDAPPLTPAHHKSRTRSLLAGRALSTHAEFYWRFDPWTGESWGQVLAYQAAKGRDVFGLSPRSIARVRDASWKRWEGWKAGKYTSPATTPAAPVPEAPAGRYGTEFATFGVGIDSADKFKTGTWTGAMTGPELRRHLRESTGVHIPGRPVNPASPHPLVGPGYNRLLGHVYGQTSGSAGTGGTAIPGPKLPTLPKPAVQRAALPPTPKPKPKPAPPPTPKPAASKTGPIGSKVSAAIDLTRSPYHNRVKATLGLIDGLHGTGGASTAKFPMLPDHAKGRQGSFSRDQSGTPMQITLYARPDALHPEFTLTHEVGHYLERCLMPGKGVGLKDRDYLNDATIAGWRAAVDASKAIGDLKKLATKTQVHGTTSKGNPVTIPVDQKYVQYNLGYNEIWARAYAQWVATRTKDPVLMAQLDHERSIAKNGIYHLRQWSDADFEPIGKAIDQLFIKIGWMR